MTDSHGKTIVVEDNPLKQSIVTALSLTFFGLTLFGTLLSQMAARDLNGIRALLMQEATLNWLVTIAPVFWLVYRTIRSWILTQRNAEVARAAPNAVPKSELVAPTRARETTMPAVRIVDAAVLRRATLNPDGEASQIVVPGEPDIPGDALTMPPQKETGR